MSTPGDSDQELLVERDDGLLTLTLNRPAQRNALSLRLRDELAAAVALVEGDASIRTVLLRGSGDHFCAGGDLKSMAAGDSATPEARLARMRSYHPLITGLARLDRPIVAAVDGVAFGAGFGLALLADLLVVSERARFCMAFQRVGLVPDFGVTYTLPRAVGLQRAKELILSGREVDAPEALRLGLALEMVPADHLHVRSRELAMALTKASAVASGLAKRALRASMQSSLSQMLEMESTAQSIAASSDYARAAFDAFSRKQPPLFQWPLADDH